MGSKGTLALNNDRTNNQQLMARWKQNIDCETNSLQSYCNRVSVPDVQLHETFDKKKSLQWSLNSTLQSTDMDVNFIC